MSKYPTQYTHSENQHGSFDSPPAYQDDKGSFNQPQSGTYNQPGMVIHATQPAVLVQVPYTLRPYLGDVPQHLTCNNCNSAVLSRVHHETGLLTWLICGGLFLVGCSLGCCLIPFCADSCKDVYHYCPNCNNLMGINKKLK